MASSSIILSEEQVQCSICLEVFTDPASIPCGHSFCMACISGYWDTIELCYCPTCEEDFNPRPELRVNTFIAEIAGRLKKSGQAKITPIAPNQALTRHGAVPCDICMGTKSNAVKSCLACLASYCQTHLEPHQIATALKKHTLIHPVENLEDRVCKKHQRPLELFCREDQVCVCQFCTEGDHKAHHTVPIEEEFIRRKAQMGQTGAEMQNMIRDRQQKVKDMKRLVENSKVDAKKGMSESVKLFGALVRSIKRSHAELKEAIPEKQKAAEKKTEEVIKELEQEITMLQERSTELEELSHTEDHLLPFLQSSPDPSTTLPHTKDWSEIVVDIDMSAGPMMRAMSQLEKTLREELTDVKLSMAKRCAVDVTLDPENANPYLILSEDGKQVRLGDPDQQIHPHQPGRFGHSLCVLGKQGFSSGRFYYEVQVRDHAARARVSLFTLARGSINKKGAIIDRTPVVGHWALGLWDECDHKGKAGPKSLSCLEDTSCPQKVGVFVDYEAGEVTFYDVEAGSQIHSFTGCSFTGSLHPCFYTRLCRDGENAAPLIISPVIHTE